MGKTNRRPWTKPEACAKLEDWLVREEEREIAGFLVMVKILRPGPLVGLEPQTVR